tara:strand:- start:1399 stop:2370 length:972 start_codon:yes stop_codon:yes gene_type:complete
MKTNDKINLCDPVDQLKLFGFEDYFSSFKNLYEKNKLPNVILLTGQKGLGKATFAYHFINYLLTSNEEFKYSLKDFSINSCNSSFQLAKNNLHPNFIVLQNDLSKESIKIDQVRNLIKFLNKSTYSQNIKIILIDNAEYLNLNSSNALLKSLEEPSHKTFFFIINNSSLKLSDTLKSRCVEYKFHFNHSEKKNIFKNIIKNYEFNLNDFDIEKFLYLDAPGNLLRYLLILNDNNLTFSKDNLDSILYLIEAYKNQNDPEILDFISLLIEIYYTELSIKYPNNLNKYFINKYQILHLFSNMKKFKLDKKNLLISVTRILKNEKQ